MSYLRGQAVTGLTFSLVNKSDGSAVTSGTVSGFVTKDGGMQATLTNTPAHKGNGQWSVDLTAAEMDAELVGLLFTHVNASPREVTIKTVGAAPATAAMQLDLANRIVAAGSVVDEPPVQFNLDATGIRGRLKDGPARVFLCGDSISVGTVTLKRLFPAALRTWAVRDFRGLFMPYARLGGGGTDGFAVLHPSTTGSTSVDKNSYGPSDTGQFSGVALPILATARYEREWSGDDGDTTRIGEAYAEDVLKPGGSDEWVGVGDWLAGRTASVEYIFLKHENGLDGVQFLTRLIDGTGTQNVFSHTFNTSVAVGQPEEIASTSAVVGMIPTDWQVVGQRMMTPTGGVDETGKGLISLFSHVFTDAGGVHLGVLAYSGLTAADWLANTSSTHLAKFIEVTKADTFVLAFGANDSGAAHDKATYKADIQAVVDAVSAAAATAQVNDATLADPRFVLLAMYDVQDRAVLGEYAQALYEVCLDTNYSDRCGFVNLFKIAGDFKLLETDLLEDGTHPTQTGAETFMRAFWTQIEQGLASALDVVVGGFEASSAAAAADAMLDRVDGVESGTTPRQAMRLMLSSLSGKLTGAGGSTIRVRDINDTKDRITATVDDKGNRTAITVDKD